MKSILILAAFLVGMTSGLCRAQETPPSPFRYMLLTDGSEVWPKHTLATDAEVTAAENKADDVSAQVATTQSEVATLGTRLAAVETSLADLNQDGVWVLEGYINSIGILSGLPEYDGTIDIVHMTVADSENTPGARTMTLWVAFDPAPSNASQVAMVGNTALEDEFGDLTYTCSYPDRVANPRDPTDTRAIYTFTADFDGASGFAKIVSLPGAAAGVGGYLPISGGLSINGINGATATFTADDGTVLTFKGGILVEADPVTLEE